MSPTGESHGHVAAQIIGSLIAYVKQRQLGRVYASETGFRISRQPDTVRAPDAAFVRTERVAPTAKFVEAAPDAAFEVTSPSDTYSEIEEKTLDWLRAGVRAVVIVDPGTKTARVHRGSGAVIVAEAIEIDDIIPGWRLPLAELFD
jgi:Uma2 family endonuclease